jgi:hypothetical protein
MVLHGSGRPDIETLEPRGQTDYSGEMYRRELGMKQVQGASNG